jgi:hypothetical protein
MCPRRVDPPEEYSEGTRPVNPMNVAARGNPPVGELAAQGQRAQRAHATVGGQPVHRVGERFPVHPSLQVSLDRSQRRVPIGRNRTVMLERGPHAGSPKRSAASHCSCRHVHAAPPRRCAHAAATAHPAVAGPACRPGPPEPGTGPARPRQPKPGRPGLVADPQRLRLPEPAEEPADQLLIVKDPLHLRDFCARTQDSRRDRILVHIQPNKDQAPLRHTGHGGRLRSGSGTVRDIRG